MLTVRSNSSVFLDVAVKQIYVYACIRASPSEICKYRRAIGIHEEKKGEREILSIQLKGKKIYRRLEIFS